MKRRRHLASIENGARAGMVAVRAAKAFGKEVPGLFVARNRLLLGSVVNGKFELKPKARFYNLRIRWKLFVHRLKVFTGRC